LEGSFHLERTENCPMKRPVGLRCTICNHPARPQIDLAIATGLAKRAVAERFSVSRDAVWRHAQAHLTAEMRAALATRLLQREGDTRRILLEEGAGVTEALKAIRGPLFGLFLAAVDTGDNKAAAALSGRLHENLALAATTAPIKHRHYRATILHYIVGGLNQEFMPQRSGVSIS